MNSEALHVNCLDKASVHGSGSPPENSGSGNAEANDPDHVEERLERAGIVEPPDGGYGWVVVFASFMTNLVVDGVIFSIAETVVPLWEKEFTTTTSAATLATSLLGGCYLLSGPLASALANNFGSVLAASGFLLSVLVPALPVLYLTFGIIGGIGYGLVFLPAIVIVGQYFSERRALATGIAVCGSGIGTTLFGFMNPVILSLVGGNWRLFLTVISATTLSCAFFGSFFKPLKASKRQIEEVANIAAEYIERQKKKTSKGMDGDSGVALSSANIDSEEPTTPAERRGQLKHVAPGVEIERIERDAPPVLMVGGRQREQIAGSRRARLHASRPFLSTIELHASSLHPTCALDEHVPLAQIVSKASVSDLNRPLSKLDIFYAGSSTSLASRLNSYDVRSGRTPALTLRDVSSELGGHKPSATMLLSSMALPAIDEEPEDNFLSRICGRHMINSLRSMIDLELLRSPSFIMLAIGGFLTLACFFVPFIFIGSLAKEKGVDPALTRSIELLSQSASDLLMILGSVNLSARVVCGLIADHCDPLVVSNSAVIVGGLATMAAPLLTEFWMLALFHCVPFAAGVACFAALRSIICVELLGIEKLTNAYGMLMLFMGVAALLGPPFAAALKNLTNSFDASFVVMGAIMLVSGLLSLPLRRVNKWELSRAAAATHCFTATELESLRGREEATQLEPLSGREETAEKKV